MRHTPPSKLSSFSLEFPTASFQTFLCSLIPDEGHCDLLWFMDWVNTAPNANADYSHLMASEKYLKDLLCHRQYFLFLLLLKRSIKAVLTPLWKPFTSGYFGNVLKNWTWRKGTQNLQSNLLLKSTKKKKRKKKKSWWIRVVITGKTPFPPHPPHHYRHISLSKFCSKYSGNFANYSAHLLCALFSL